MSFADTSATCGAEFTLAMHMDQRTRNNNDPRFEPDVTIKQDAETQAKLKGFADIFYS